MNFRFYDHRDEHGTMKNRIPYITGRDIFANLSGKWRDYNSKAYKTRAFEITEDGSMTIRGDGGLNKLIVYFWKGDLLVERDS